MELKAELEQTKAALSSQHARSVSEMERHHLEERHEIQRQLAALEVCRGQLFSSVKVLTLLRGL